LNIMFVTVTGDSILWSSSETGHSAVPQVLSVAVITLWHL